MWKIKVRGDAWFMRWFYWTRANWGYLFGDDSLDRCRRDSRRTVPNTCLYLRTVGPWFVLLILLYAVLLAGPFVAIFGPPIYMFGWAGLFYLCGGIAGACAFVAAILTTIWLAFKLGEFIGPSLGRFLSATGNVVGGAVGTAVEKCRDPQIGFCTLIWKCITDAHGRVCTQFEVVEETKS